MTKKLINIIRFLLLGVLLYLLAACGQTASPGEADVAIPTTTSEAYIALPTPTPIARRTVTPPPSPTPSSAILPVATLPPLRELPTLEPRSIKSYSQSYSLGLQMDVTEGEASAEAITSWLARFRSPQLQEAPPGESIGQTYVRLGRKYGINPAYAVAFFTKESTCGTNGSNLAAFNFGNIRWTPGYNTLDKVWRAYSSWTEGMEDWFRLIQSEYVNKGLRTVDQIVPIYAPPSENDTSLYASQIKEWVTLILAS